MTNEDVMATTRTIAWLTRHNVQLNEIATEAQAKCTELLERARRAEAERDTVVERYTELEARVSLLAAHQTEPAPPMADSETSWNLRSEIFAGEVDPRGRALADVLPQAEQNATKPTSGFLGYSRDGQRVYGSGLSLDDTMAALESIRSGEITYADDDEPTSSLDRGIAQAVAAKAAGRELPVLELSKLQAIVAADDDEPSVSDAEAQR